MKKQHGGISTGAIIAIIGGSLIALVILSCISSYVTWANYGNRTEVALDARVQDNKNIYAQGTQKVLEVAQVPAMARDDIAKVAEAAIKGRYGANGSTAVFQAIKEQNPSVDPSLYRKIQQLVEAFRNEFQNGQKTQIEQVRSYRTNIGNVWSGFWLARAGYPKADLKKYDVISTDRADDVYQRGKESGPLQLR
jgi:uncharacterized protein (UPF0333 family)